MTLKKNISSGNKSTNLLSIFQRYFSSKFNLARIKFICLLISSLCKVKTVNFQKLSIGFDNKAATSSNYRRIQRFLADVVLPMRWIAQLIFSLLPEKNNLILVMDRTNWKLGGKDINILMLGISYKNFNLEDTHVTQMDRIEKLVLLVMLAFVWCYKIGDYIDTNIKAIRIIKHGSRAISIFKYGLDYLSRILISGINYLKINVYQFLSCS